MSSPAFVIEHLEPMVGRWLLLEYTYASMIVGCERLCFTNVKRPEDAAMLQGLGRVEAKRACEIYPPTKVLVLDPKAKRLLQPEDFAGKEAVLIGGILGDHPPRNRTSRLLTVTFPEAAVRSLGKSQFSIDGAVYVAKRVSEGVPLRDIPIKKGLTIKVSRNHEIHLPYIYPIADGKPLINPRLVEYLASMEIVEDEEHLLTF